MWHELVLGIGGEVMAMGAVTLYTSVEFVATKGWEQR